MPFGSHEPSSLQDCKMARKSRGYDVKLTPDLTNWEALWACTDKQAKDAHASGLSESSERFYGSTLIHTSVMPEVTYLDKPAINR